MRGLLRDFRDAPVVWGAVLLLLSVVQCVSGMVMVMLSNARMAMTVPGLHDRAVIFYMELSGPPLVPMVIVGMLMVLLVVSSAIRQRRRPLALIALQGATPGQLTLRVCVQVLLLDVVATLVSLVVSPALARGLYPFATRQLEADGLPFLPQDVTGMLRALGCGVVFGFAMALVGSLLTARAIGGISPVGALREASDPPKTVGVIRLVLAWIMFAGALASLAAGLLNVRKTSMARMSVQVTFSSMSPLAYGNMIAMLLFTVSVCLAGPAVLSATVRMWTAVACLPWPAWRIACQQTRARVCASSSTIIPLAAGLTLLMSYESLTATITAWTRLLPAGTPTVEVPGFARILALIGTSLVLVLTAVCSGYLIAQRGRELDLALVAVSGGTQGQLNAIAALDGLMTVITSSLIAFVPSLLVSVSFSIGIWLSFDVLVFGMPWIPWLVVVIVLAVMAMLGSWLTAQRGIRTPPTVVIAHAAGE